MHHIRFTRHAVTGETRATCTCGDSLASDRDTAQAWAEHHLARPPIDQTPIQPATYESGLAKN